ncbi:MAG: electron transfer flavoprotein subunit beta/FixA family protein [Deltaproteobacteria bacterium]|nr:electron transfer flavoprotein subunit beta/FixA family protein [Deltaproteobacteria bacterium]
MRLIVCLKPVPDPKHWHRLSLDPESGTLVREGIPAAINPLDKNALEAALRLREAHGGEVIVLSMAPPEMRPILVEALALGADRAVLLADRGFAGSDTLATACILAGAIRRLSPCDAVLCGNETIDSGTAQVSAQVAEFLDLPNLSGVSAIEARAGQPWLVRSRIEAGQMTVEVAPPMVLAVIKEINQPRFATLMNVLEAEEKEIVAWSATDLSLDEPWMGLEGSPTWMAGLFSPEKRPKAEMLAGSPAEQAGRLADRLHRRGWC